SADVNGALERWRSDHATETVLGSVLGLLTPSASTLIPTVAGTVHAADLGGVPQLPAIVDCLRNSLHAARRQSSGANRNVKRYVAIPHFIPLLFDLLANDIPPGAIGFAEVWRAAGHVVEAGAPRRRDLRVASEEREVVERALHSADGGCGYVVILLPLGCLCR